MDRKMTGRIIGIVLTVIGLSVFGTFYNQAGDKMFYNSIRNVVGR